MPVNITAFSGKGQAVFIKEEAFIRINTVCHIFSNPTSPFNFHRCLPRPAHHLFAFKRLELSDTEEVKYKNARLSH